ncbi:PfkB family carbohydrate kinase, partial [Streptomyces sp. NPDC056437]|uniref:PfkB family carbohydrate kinase n=1 Tax=Streptomyces sp. NPDC056437 TaxID=3345816 RepID=UPI00368E6B2C
MTARIVGSGTIATDHLMTFPGSISEQLLPDEAQHVSPSFLVDHLDIRPAGASVNVAVGLARLGLRPLLVGSAAGADFADHAGRLGAAGIDTTGILVVPDLHTARFLCTTDRDHHRITSFYPSAMSRAATIDLAKA